MIHTAKIDLFTDAATIENFNFNTDEDVENVKLKGEIHWTLTLTTQQNDSDAFFEVHFCEADLELKYTISATGEVVTKNIRFKNITVEVVPGSLPSPYPTKNRIDLNLDIFEILWSDNKTYIKVSFGNQ